MRNSLAVADDLTRRTAASRPRQAIRGLCALAVLPRQMPLLRFQLACPPWRHRRRPLPRRLSHGARPFRVARAGAQRLQHLLRRRHAVADASKQRRGDPRQPSPSIGGSRPTPRSRLKPTRPASRSRTSRATASAGVNRLSLGVQALDDQSLKALGRLHSGERSARRARACQATFRARVVRPDLFATRGRRSGRGRMSSSSRSATRRIISRFISSPSRTARRSPHDTQPAR